MTTTCFDRRAVRTFQTVLSCCKQELTKVDLAWFIDNSIHPGNVTTLWSIFRKVDSSFVFHEFICGSAQITMASEEKTYKILQRHVAWFTELASKNLIFEFFSSCRYKLIFRFSGCDSIPSASSELLICDLLRATKLISNGSLSGPTCKQFIVKPCTKDKTERNHSKFRIKRWQALFKDGTLLPVSIFQ